MDVSTRDVLAIGTSAGGVEALLFLAKQMPRDFPASILVTIHLPPQAHSSLDEILTRAGHLSAKFASEGEALQKGHIYLAPPDHHLLLEGNRLCLGYGPRENNSRPAIDPMSAGRCGLLWTAVGGRGPDGYIGRRGLRSLGLIAMWRHNGRTRPERCSLCRNADERPEPC